MADLALTDAERAFFRALEELGVRYLVIGMGAAVLQGADVGTKDIDVWFADRDDRRIHDAASRAGGVWIPDHFGMMPPMIGGDELGDRLDVVFGPRGLDDFATEHARALSVEVDGIVLRVLPLDRVIASKRAAGRPKDLAALPALEAALAARREVEGDEDG